MRHILASCFFLLPAAGFAQGLEPSVDAGVGLTASRNRSGEALHAQVGFTAIHLGEMRLRAEVFHQEGTNGGAGKCERLDERYCIGTTDRNRISSLSASLHVPLGARGPVTAYVPAGVGLYRRSTRTTETEGPIELCTDSGVIVPCPGNPPLSSVTYDHSATRPGYHVGVGLMTRVLGVNLYAEARAHDILESDSIAGAVPFSIGVRF
jgi:opacity protein-like surface antigen